MRLAWSSTSVRQPSLQKDCVVVERSTLLLRVIVFCETLFPVQRMSSLAPVKNFYKNKDKKNYKAYLFKIKLLKNNPPKNKFFSEDRSTNKTVN